MSRLYANTTPFLIRGTETNSLGVNSYLEKDQRKNSCLKRK
jgi:hypothetical protein